MALSQRKKNEQKRGWVIVSGDASLRYGEILEWFPSRKEAMKARLPLFAHHREETLEESLERRGLVEETFPV